MTTPQRLTDGRLDPPHFSLISQVNGTTSPNAHVLPQTPGSSPCTRASAPWLPPAEDCGGPVTAALVPAGDACHETGLPRDHVPAPPVSSQEDDVALLQRVAGQDHQAFDTVYARYAPRLRHYLTHRLHDAALAEDVCQDVMLVVWQQAGRVPATVPLWAWLCGIARHKAHTAWARTTSRALVPAEPADRQAAAPDVLMLRQEAGRVFEQALSTLPFYERTALVWLMQYGCSYQEIAARMDTPVSTVRTRLWRAGHRLRAAVTAAAPPTTRPARVSAGPARRRAPQQPLQQGR